MNRTTQECLHRLQHRLGRHTVSSVFRAGMVSRGMQIRYITDKGSIRSRTQSTSLSAVPRAFSASEDR